MSIGRYEITTGNGVNRLEIEVLFDGIPSKPLTAEYHDGEWVLIQTCPVCVGRGTIPVSNVSLPEPDYHYRKGPREAISNPGVEKDAAEVRKRWGCAPEKPE